MKFSLFQQNDLEKRAVKLNKNRMIGMSSETASNLDVDSDCKKNSKCQVSPESGRKNIRAECSRQIGNSLFSTDKIANSARSHKALLDEIKDKVVEAASNSCFPAEIVLALVSRLSVVNNSFRKSDAGWVPCQLSKYS